MKVSILGRSRKGTLDFELKSDDEFGFKIQCEDGEGMVVFNNIASIQWLAEGRIVYMNPDPVKGTDQYNFARYDVIKISKAKKIAEESFEHHYWKE